jgi:hypothetical protein
VSLLLPLPLLFCGRSGQAWGLSGRDPPNPPAATLTLLRLHSRRYFMCMFFFISGYFTPSSFAKKGKYQ